MYLLLYLLRVECRGELCNSHVDTCSHGAVLRELCVIAAGWLLIVLSLAGRRRTWQGCPRILQAHPNESLVCQDCVFGMRANKQQSGTPECAAVIRTCVTRSRGGALVARLRQEETLCYV